MAEKQLTTLLAELVRIPSVCPPGAPDDASVVGEARLAAHLAQHLGALGFAVTLEEQEPGRPNLIAVHGPDRPQRTILVEAHLDTVSVRDMSIAPFAGEVRDGRLYGRGACDTKGPMAAALYALRPPVLEMLAAAGCRLIFVGAMGEEAGNEGADHLVQQGRVAADEAIVLEPTGLRVVHAHKGTLWLRIVAAGRTAHGSTPGDGISAVDGLMGVVAELRRGLGDVSGRSSAALGPPTINLGCISGGAAVNIVPGRCTADLDRRTLPEESHAGVLDGVRRVLDRYETEGRLTGHEIEVVKDAPSYWTSPDAGLVKRLRAAAAAEGADLEPGGTAWFSDAGPLAKICREVVVFGPGHIAQAHTPDEYIDLDELARGAAILRRFFLDHAKGVGPPAGSDRSD